MTRARVATIIRCGDRVHEVFETLQSVERQIGGPGVIVLATDASTPHAARSWIEHLAASRNLVAAHAPDLLPGAVKNAGVRAAPDTDYAMCLDAGDLLDAGFHAECGAALDANPAAAFAAAGVLERTPEGDRRVLPPARVDIAALVAATEAVDAAALFRRAVWASICGFDEHLPALDHYDLWLRMLAEGHAGAGIDRTLIVRLWRDNGPYRRAWDEDKHTAAMATIVARHGSVFEADPARALCARERAIAELAGDYAPLLERHKRTLDELPQLSARAAELRETLRTADALGVDFGDLRRTSPLARDWGYGRGVPIDRYYIERFLEQHAADIRGVVLEIQEPDYTQRYGGNRVTRSDVVDLNPANARATIVSDLRCAANIPDDTYDCIILTQTLHVIDDMEQVIAECARLLRPGGVLLATLPSASRVCLEYGQRNDFWRVTSAGALRLFSKVFPERSVEVHAHGNVLVNAAFLYGLAAHELTDAEFTTTDPYFPLVVAVRATKPGCAVAESPVRRTLAPGEGHAAILLYHRVASPATDVHGLAVTPEQFGRHMALLRAEYDLLSLEELIAAIQRGRIPSRAVAVTFDDGYVDNLTSASPVLLNHRVPATFFVTTERLTERLRFWWDTLESVLLTGRPLPLSLTIDLPGGRRSLATATAADRRTAHDVIYHEIVASPAAQRDEVTAFVARWSGHGGADNLPDAAQRMAAEEVVALARRPGHSVGAHGVHHLMMRRQPVAVQREEVERSRHALEALLGSPVEWFAYPFGAASAETDGELRRSSFSAALTCDERLVTARDDLLRLPRFQVTPARAHAFHGWLKQTFESRPISTASS
jgi:peptidoglycan/xylan/chitin deacetylase (PgdA/CDA1 family)/SAM-dependent methyltransferase